MPTFLTTNDVYNVINRELPEGLFAYSPSPNKFYITSELYSYASNIAVTYGTMQTIYNNMFVTTMAENVADYEVMYFGSKSTANLTLEERRGRILAKIRSQLSVSLWDILTFIVSYLPVGTYAQIVEYGNYNSWDVWQVGVDFGVRNAVDSCELGTMTYLANECPQEIHGALSDTVWGPGWNYLDPLPAHVSGDTQITQAKMLAMRITAYTYEIRIFGYAFTTEAQAQFEQDLIQIHPIRSQYYLVQNQVLSDYRLTTDVDNVSQFTSIPAFNGPIRMVNCIKNDPTQTTGYRGKVYTV
jgi:hypothetical protein